MGLYFDNAIMRVDVHARDASEVQSENVKVVSKNKELRTYSVAVDGDQSAAGAVNVEFKNQKIVYGHESVLTIYIRLVNADATRTIGVIEIADKEYASDESKVNDLILDAVDLSMNKCVRVGEVVEILKPKSEILAAIILLLE